MPPLAVLNAGSSSLKFAILDDERPLCRGQVERIGVAGAEPYARIQDGTGTTLFGERLSASDPEAVLEWIFGWVPTILHGVRPVAIGHRVVHGGETFTAPVRITAEILTQLEALIPLAPLHQPHNLAPIRYLARRDPSLPQVACFDTAFHATQSRLERLFALPRSYFDRGIKRYGFHGLSYEYIASCLSALDPRAAAGRTIVCHLGNGASMCALSAGRSVATTMSFTALDGLPMGTRCGSLDPGVLLYLLAQEKMDPGAVSDLLYRQSGLLGISGTSSDMRDLLADPRPEAVEAVEFFCYRIARELGTLTAVLGGLDALVFTAGIGENAAAVRAKVCDRSAWLGVRIDPVANAANQTVLHALQSQVAVYIVPTDEERMIARHVRNICGLAPG